MSRSQRKKALLFLYFIIFQDLQQFLDSSPEGVIYFSLGSNIQSTHLHQREIEVLTSAFKQLAPVKVLWKWEKDVLPGKPDNVRTQKWLPQNDILGKYQPIF